MPRTLRRLLPSPAMVVALIALVLSLGGSAYALVITGASIRNNTVTGKDIRKHSLRGHDLRANSVGGGAVKETSLGAVPLAFAAGTAGRPRPVGRPQQRRRADPRQGSGRG